MHNIYITTKISPVPEIRNIMLKNTNKKGVWSFNFIDNENISRDWLYWLCALEGHDNTLLIPRFIFPTKFDIIQRFSPNFPHNLGQPIDILLFPDLIRQNHETIILATNNQAVSASLYLRKKKLLRSRVCCVLHGIADKLEKMSEEDRIKSIAELNLSDKQLVWGDNECAYLRSMGIKNIFKIDFGVDTYFWHPDSESGDDYILSVGWDNLRDFSTLSKAIDDENLLRAKIICDPVIGKSLMQENVDIIAQPSCLELRQYFRNAKIVVVTTYDSLRPSGQITILQAMACAKPVIMTETRGTWSDKLIPGENCLIVPEKDIIALRSAIYFLLNNPSLAENMGRKAREMVIQNYNFENMRSMIMDRLLSD